MLGIGCTKDPQVSGSDIIGFELLSDISGHWIGSNETAYGNFDWFSFDFRPISSSHIHSIYEGATNQNIITSIFIADFGGKQQIMARNGGWLGPQYRATYFVLDKAERRSGGEKYYRLVDAIGGASRSYIEFRFKDGVLNFDAYKDNSGSLDEPIKHMGFEGTNQNPTFAQASTEFFNFPQEVSEVNLENTFINLIDPDSALFLSEESDPFPKSDHGHLSELIINFNRDPSIQNKSLVLYISKEAIVNVNGMYDLDNINTQLIRVINIRADELSYATTYLHPDKYYITAFYDNNDDLIVSTNDVTSVTPAIDIIPETIHSITADINVIIQ